ncbi:MAG: pyruvate kinase [Bacteroidota bacterium]
MNISNIASSNFNKTKIIATIGPACQSKTMLAGLIDSGVSIVRLNFSHGTHAQHQQVIDTVRELNQVQGRHIALLQDLQGPKLRVGEVAGDVVKLTQGAKLTITTEPLVGTAEKVSTTYQDLAKDVQIGDKLLVDDGKIILKAVEKTNTDLITEVLHGGWLRSRKGINLPFTQLSSSSLTKKDQEDLQFGLQNDVEWIALSFVREVQDVVDLKAKIAAAGKTARVVAKIEKPEALDNIDAIIQEADAVMVARGDLGVEIAMERVPLEQKRIVSKCNQAGKPVIIATQMMESMIESPTPTRAETNDIANAVIDGADAVMLSAETAVGKYPREVIRQMKKTVLIAEKHPAVYNRYQDIATHSSTFYNENVVQTACRLSQEIKAKAIVCMTQSGWVAFELAKHRPQAAIFFFTANRSLLNTINLIWGARGYYYDKMVSTDDTFADIEHLLTQTQYLKKGDVFISMASMPIEARLHTNMLKVNIVA